MNTSHRPASLQAGNAFRLPFRLRNLIVAAAMAATLLPGAAAMQISRGATWKYIDNGGNLGTAWKEVAFDDSAWRSGAAQLGYGDGDEATVLGWGPDGNNKYATSYFRHTFNVASRPGSLRLRLLRDDGAIVYLNGTEVFRSNLPTGTVTSSTYATVAIGGAEESTLFLETFVDPALLQIGTNVVAVEIHQSSGSSSDISFDLELLSDDALRVSRGPYLQSGSTSSVVVRWRTNSPSNTRVRYGTLPSSLSSVVDDLSLTTEHEVRLTGLAPGTTYYYSIGSTTDQLAGGDTQHTFTTAPMTAVPTRIWVIGDSGTADSNARAVRDAYKTFTGTRRTDLWLMLGDNAYPSGTDVNYQAAVFDMYPELLRQTVLWPTIGNHDTAGSTTPSGDLPYFQMFTLPTQGEAGGLASGTEKYYSFDHGNVHFIVLDSMTSDRSPTGAMLTWLRNDLLATSKDWIIAYWHHPPYSKGSHNSDVETALVQMRTNALPILEDGGVDLVLAGHSHSYERSFLLDGHYGSSSTLTDSQVLDAGSGREGGSGAYRKPTLGPGAHEGAVYAVAGNGGKLSGGTLNHPAMFISLNVLGSMVLDVDSNRLDAKLVRETGVVADFFTIIKGSTAAAPAAPSGLVAAAVSSSRVDLDWADASSNEDGFLIERATNGGSFAQIAAVGANFAGYSDLSVQGATSYSYRVRAYNEGGQSAYSNTASATTPAAPAPPTAPTGLSATAEASDRIRLTWTDTSANEDGVRVERSTAGSGFQLVATVGASVTAFLNTGLQPSTTYSYRVLAFNASGDSSYSNTASATTPAIASAPAAPSNLTASAVSGTRIDLRWIDNSSNETGFEVERSSNATTFTRLLTMGANATTYADTAASPNQFFYYRVRSVNANGASAYSNTVKVKTKRR